MVWTWSSPTSTLICRFREAARGHQFPLCAMAETPCLLVPKCMINSIPCGILGSSILPFSFSCLLGICEIYLQSYFYAVWVTFFYKILLWFFLCQDENTLHFCTLCLHSFFFTARFCSDLTDFILFIVLSSLNNEFSPHFISIFLCSATVSIGLFPFCVGW